MRSARRLKRKSKSEKKLPRVLLFVLVVLAGLFLLFLFLTKKSLWLKDAKFSLVLNGSEEISVVTFDPVASDMTVITIPASLQVDSARGFGKWKLGSIGKLGENEGLPGILLKETIVKNFGFPVYSWMEAEASELLDAGVGKRISSLFLSRKTNLGFVDKLKVSFFLTKIQDSDIKKIDLSSTPYLRKTKLAGGEEGYSLTKTLPASLALVFSDTDIANKKLRVQVLNGSSADVLENVASVVELLGAKVVSELKSEPSEEDCKVVTNEELFGKFLSYTFGCKLSLSNPQSSVDVEIEVGEKFSERF